MTAWDIYLGELAAQGRLDLPIELKEAMRRVTEFGGFSVLTKALRIPRTAIEECGGLGVMRIRTSGRYFEPTEAGATAETAVIVPVWERDLGGDLVDLLALRLDHPALFHVRTGYARCIGTSFADEISDGTTLWSLPDDVHPSLPLFPNPLIWLRNNCAGAVLLHRAWITYLLTGIKSVTAYNERHAKALYELLYWRGGPKVYLRQHNEAA